MTKKCHFRHSTAIFVMFFLKLASLSCSTRLSCFFCPLIPHRNFLLIPPRRLSRYQQFKDFQRRILVATNLFGRGMDIERVNIVFNYDMPEDSDTYLHRVSASTIRITSDLCRRPLKPRAASQPKLCSSTLGCPCRPVWNQRPGRHLCVRRDGCKDPEWRPRPLWSQRSRAARGDRHLLLQ